MTSSEISGKSLLIAEWCLISIAIIFVAVRLWVRHWQRNWSFWVSDVILVFSIFPFLALVIGDTTILVDHLAMDEGLFAPPPTISGWKWKFAVAIIYDAMYYFPRFSLLAFYYQLFPITEPKLRVCLYLVTAYTVLAFIAVILLDVFWCGSHVSQNWSPTTSCATWMTVEIIYINWPIGMLAELLVFVLPFGMLARLKALQGGERIGLICIFLLGFATVIVSVSRFIMITKGLLLYSTYVAALVEAATQIVITALPALRPLLRLGWERVSSQVGTKASGQSEKGTNRKESHTSEAGFMAASLPSLNEIPE